MRPAGWSAERTANGRGARPEGASGPWPAGGRKYILVRPAYVVSKRRAVDTHARPRPNRAARFSDNETLVSLSVTLRDVDIIGMLTHAERH